MSLLLHNWHGVRVREEKYKLEMWWENQKKGDRMEDAHAYLMITQNGTERNKFGGHGLDFSRSGKASTCELCNELHGSGKLRQLLASQRAFCYVRR
jgi:hypothetical protein